MKGRFFNFACTLIVVLLCSCTGKDYKSVIPSDSDVVVMINLKNMAEKGDLANSKAMKLAKENMGIVVSPKDRDKVQNFIDDPAKIGIDFREPACLFQRADGSMGLVMKVADKDDLEEFMTLLRGNSVMSKAVERDGVMCCKLLDEVGVFYDDHAVLLYSGKTLKTSENDTKVACQLMKQDDDMSYKSTYDFDTDIDDKDIVVMSNDIRGGLKNVLLPKEYAALDAGVGDVPVLLTVDFEKGKVAVEAEAKPADEKGKAAMEETSKHLHKINGIFSEYDTKFVPMWMYAGVDGQWLLKEMKKNASVKEYLFMLERCIDIEQMIAAVDGDIVVGLNPSKDMSLTAIAQVKDTDFMKDVDYWTKSMKEYGASMSRVSANDYCLRFADSATRVFWGMKNDNIYLSTISRPEHGAGKMVKTLADGDLTDCWLYMYVDMKELRKEKSMPSMYMAGAKLDFESMVVKSKEFGRLDIDVNVKNKDVNVLKYLLE